MQVKTQLEDIQNYLTDASNMQGGHADKLFIPESTEEIAEILRGANESQTPVTVSGARTGTVGGAIPFGGYIISLEKLNKVEIHKDLRTATVGAGVILGDLQKAVEAEGLFIRQTRPSGAVRSAAQSRRMLPVPGVLNMERPANIFGV